VFIGVGFGWGVGFSTLYLKYFHILSSNINAQSVLVMKEVLPLVS
jgi:hypothetical protein